MGKIEGKTCIKAAILGAGTVGGNCYKKLPVKEIRDCTSKFFLRILVEDKPGVLACMSVVKDIPGIIRVY